MSDQVQDTAAPIPTATETAKPRMTSGGKIGLVIWILWLINFAVNLVLANVKDDLWQEIGPFLAFTWLILLLCIPITSIVTGMQKARPGIAVLAFLLSPIGFFIALAAENRKK